MKIKLLFAAALIATNAHAHLIDETPGGFNLNNPPPLFFELVGRHSQLAGANINGSQVIWSPFEPFGPNEFSITTNDIDASISWNLANTDGYMFQFLLLEGVGGIDHIYSVSGQERTEGSNEFATIDGSTNIQAIIFYGTNHIPDTGGTLSMLVVAAGILFSCKTVIRLGRTPVLLRGIASLSS